MEVLVARSQESHLPEDCRTDFGLVPGDPLEDVLGGRGDAVDLFGPGEGGAPSVGGQPGVPVVLGLLQPSPGLLLRADAVQAAVVQGLQGQDSGPEALPVPGQVAPAG